MALGASSIMHYYGASYASATGCRTIRACLVFASGMRKHVHGMPGAGGCVPDGLVRFLLY
ncbi:hypothetical protein ANFP_28890 [Acidithiobacillus ferrooxidans]|nr:hypothetical protein ANFP_28890 [Acidithiobacillus ferrooxidans]